MCTTEVYTDVYPDGRRKEIPRTTYCPARCPNPVIYKHPPRVIQYEPNNQYLYAQPGLPTPHQSPRTTTPVYSSGNESDRSRRSSGSASKQRRESGVYLNGTKILDLNRKRQSRGERIVIVDSPPTSRTPPKTYNNPYSAPSSPNANIPYNIVSAAPRDAGLRPVIVDERPRHVSIEVVNDAPNKHHSHRRHGSHSSHHSHSSSNNSDEERRRRKKQDREDQKRAEDEIKRQKVRARIAAANEEIQRRPAVPLKRTSTTTYVRPKVEVEVPGAKIRNDRDRELAEAMARLAIERRERDAQKQDDEAQRQRLMERMAPKRRSTVGPGMRRHRVMYDDGIYRWE
jgi:hypothetical protein